MNTIDIAKICHNANRAICEAAGDHSQKPWDEAAEWQRASAVSGVRFRIANPNAPAGEQHRAWMRDKFAAGWVYGPVKDEQKKTHPCLVDFDQLPVVDQIKDHVFGAIVDTLKDYADAC